MASIRVPPPSYDTVVGQGVRPSAPPLSEALLSPGPSAYRPPSFSEPSPQPGHTSDHTPVPQAGGHRTMLLKASTGHFIEYYVSCSLCGYMHTNVLMPSQFQVPDPELDVEAHLGGQGRASAMSRVSRQKRLQCVSGVLCCCWVIMVIVFFVLPVVMVITGISGRSSCTSQLIALYLIGGGILYALLVLFRTISSSLTCGRNRGCLKMRRGSSHSAAFICTFEVLFLTLLLSNLIALALGTYLVMKDIKNGGTSECSGGIYRSTVFFVLLQYLMYLLAGLFSCLTYGCHKCLTSN